MCFLRSPLCMYTWVINVCPGWKTAGNRGNHQNFDPTLLTKKLWPFNMRMKQKKNFSEKINLKWPPKKKTYLSKSPILKQAKNAFLVFFGPFWAYVRQPHVYIDWAKSMPFASINSTNPRTDPRNFREKISRIGDFEK